MHQVEFHAQSIRSALDEAERDVDKALAAVANVVVAMARARADNRSSSILRGHFAKTQVAIQRLGDLQAQLLLGSAAISRSHSDALDILRAAYPDTDEDCEDKKRAFFGTLRLADTAAA